MNCPSRTDDTLEQPGWNQNPPVLAPDLTTRQDLNGISNAREQLDRGGLEGASFAGWDEEGIAAVKRGWHPDKSHLVHGGATLTVSGRSPEGQQPLREQSKGLWTTTAVKEWTRWLLSVLVVAAVISHMRPGNTTVRYLPAPSMKERDAMDAIELSPMPKRSTCEQGGVKGDEYDLPLHVAGLFIILGVSTLACAFPILAVWFPRLRIPPAFLFFVTHFGTGVLIATAFVHLLPTAFTSLNDPCLSSFWTSDYPAMPGAISLAGIFLVTVIEMVFSPARHCCRPRLDDFAAPTAKTPPAQDPPVPVPEIDITEPPNSAPTSQPPPAFFLDGRHLSDLGPLRGRSNSISRSINRMGEENEGITRVQSAPDGLPVFAFEENIVKEPMDHDVERDDDTSSLSPELQEKKSMMQVVLLEMGILFHSVFIGMSLSVSVGNSFVILLVAIVFHQGFEGLALGARIASLNWPRKACQPWLMSLAYGCTTPIGQAIGLATHTLYSPNSEVGLLVVGTMNAISAGLLIYASLVELLSEDFLSDESWRVLRGRKRVIACLLVFGGAFCMSLVGAWA